MTRADEVAVLAVRSLHGVGYHATLSRGDGVWRVQATMSRKAVAWYISDADTDASMVDVATLAADIVLHVRSQMVEASQ